MPRSLADTLIDSTSPQSPSTRVAQASGETKDRCCGGGARVPALRRCKIRLPSVRGLAGESRAAPSRAVETRPETRDTPAEGGCGQGVGYYGGGVRRSYPIAVALIDPHRRAQRECWLARS